MENYLPLFMEKYLPFTAKKRIIDDHAVKLIIECEFS